MEKSLRISQWIFNIQIFGPTCFDNYFRKRIREREKSRRKHFTSIISSRLGKSADKQRFVFFSFNIIWNRSRIDTDRCFVSTISGFDESDWVWFSRINIWTDFDISSVIRPYFTKYSNTSVIVKTLRVYVFSKHDFNTFSYRSSRMFFSFRLFAPFCSRSKNTMASVTCKPSVRRL